MMREGKAFASLSSGLLARKGQARPAMRPQGFGFHQGSPEDLGWNDMGHDVKGHDAPRPAGARLPADLSGGPAPVPPVVVRQQEEIAREFAAQAEPAPVALVAKKAAPAREARPVRKAARVAASYVAQKVRKPREEGRKAAFTLRLDTERHLRLRLACAVQNRSAQQLLVEALDRLLGDLPDVERLAASLPHKD